MIIRSLHAENLLKYRTLRLDELPEQGVIAVSGDNESGKSAIGEIICFALFGRTYSLAKEDLRKLVRWGASDGQVRLRFASKDRELEIIRQLGRGGEQSARLVHRDRSEKPLARGLDVVNLTIEQMLGFDFAEYIETFYLAQREITAPQPHSPAVKAIAGIGPLERCAREFREEIARKQESARLLEERAAEVQKELGDLGHDRLRVGELEQELERRSGSERELAEHIGKLSAATDDYCAARGSLRSRRYKSALAGFLQIPVLISALGGVGLWALFRFEPQLWPLPMFRRSVEASLTAAGLSPEATLVFVCIAFLGTLLLIWLWSFSLKLGIKRRRAQGRKLEKALLAVDFLEPDDLSLEEKIAEDALEPGDVPLEAPRLVDKPDSERRTRLAKRARMLEAKSEEVRAAARHEVAWMERRRQALRAQREALEQTLSSARSDRVRGQELAEKSVGLAGQLDDCRGHIETRRLACELLGGAARQLAEGFNEHLRRLIALNMPRFTGGRYEYLQVGENLDVRVYSNEKRSFLDLEEISSGTQRQIMLALRLALAREQVARIGKDRQFAFLDEPFAFFDDTRMRSSLRLLRELSDLIPQHWVVAQRFPHDELLAFEVRCESGSDVLELGWTEARRR